jgi:hypothetical protein
VSASPLIQAIQQRLRAAGYSDLLTPIKVAGVEFAFTGAMRGRNGRSLDLVLLVDTATGDFGDRDGARVRQRVEALSRALDVTGSRFVVTVILAGAVLAEAIDALSETCRVLHVENVALNDEGKPKNEVCERLLDDQIRVLLPLTLPASISESNDAGGSAMQQLIRALPSDTESALVNALITASGVGEQAVTDAAARVINTVFEAEQGGEQL